MKNKKRIILCTFLSLSSMALSLIIFSNNISNSHAISNEYAINLDSKSKFTDSEKASSGDATTKTVNQNEVNFHYYNFTDASTSNWQNIEKGGEFSNTSRINGLTNIEIKFYHSNQSFKIQWSKDKIDGTGAEIFSKDFTHEDSSTSFSFNFDSYKPNYFCFINTLTSEDPFDNYLGIVSIKLSFECHITYPTVDITSEDADKGSVYSSIGVGAKKENTDFIIAAYSKEGYTFKGWYEPNSTEPYSQDLILPLTVGSTDLFLEARFEESKNDTYKVFLYVDGENGTASGGGEYSYNSDVTIVSTPKLGYQSLGWFEANGDLKNENAYYDFKMPKNDLCYVTKFSKSYVIECLVKEGEGTVSQKSSALPGKEVTIIATPNFENKFAFDCWKDESGHQISQDSVYTFIMPEDNVKFYAYFKAGGHKFDVKTSNPEYGQVSGTGYYLEGHKAKITATSNEGYKFYSWFENEEDKAGFSINSSYEYIVKESDVSFTASFCSDSEYKVWAEGHGSIPNISESFVTYGLYPDTHLQDSELIEKFNSIESIKEKEFFTYENNVYLKDIGNPYESGYKFNDGDEIISGETYYFICNPIKWNKKDLNDGSYLLSASNILNSYKYGAMFEGMKDKTDYKGETAFVYANNYQFSEIRSWLNTTFYHQAFILNNSFINFTTVDNSPSTTYSSMNPFACDPTEDKIFLKSYKDVINITNTQLAVTDYALCNGVSITNSDNLVQNGYYWTRSPDSSFSFCSSIFDNLGNAALAKVDDDKNGVSPCLIISKN